MESKEAWERYQEEKQSAKELMEAKMEVWKKQENARPGKRTGEKQEHVHQRSATQIHSRARSQVHERGAGRIGKK